MNAMRLTPQERRIAAVNLAGIMVFGCFALRGGNYEFLLYVAIVILLVGVLIAAQPRLKFGTGVLWGLTAWGLLHLAGGNVRVGAGVLYDVQLIPVVLRYDQFVHAFGFGTATLALHHMLVPALRPERQRGVLIACLSVLMGCGAGAINEIVEFVAVKSFPRTNVGGYDNTMWDIVFNLIGALIAMIGLSRRRNKVVPSASTA